MHGGIVAALCFVLFALAVRGANVATFVFCHVLKICNSFGSDLILFSFVSQSGGRMVCKDIGCGK